MQLTWNAICWAVFNVYLYYFLPTLPHHHLNAWIRSDLAVQYPIQAFSEFSQSCARGCTRIPSLLRFTCRTTLSTSATAQSCQSTLIGNKKLSHLFLIDSRVEKFSCVPATCWVLWRSTFYMAVNWRVTALYLQNITFKKWRNSSKLGKLYTYIVHVAGFCPSTSAKRSP